VVTLSQQTIAIQKAGGCNEVNVVQGVGCEVEGRDKMPVSQVNYRARVNTTEIKKNKTVSVLVVKRRKRE